jgi:hypothetical protein
MSHQHLPSTYFDWPARPHGLYLHDGVYNEYINYDYYAGDEIHENNVAFRGSSYISFDDTHTRWLNKTDIHMYDTSSIKLFDSGTFTMHTSASPFSRGFVVDSIGRVGIGMVHEEPHSNVMESPSFDLDVRGTVGIEDFIYHNDDTDTYMLFGADETTHYVNSIGDPNLATTTDFDEINFRVGGVDMIQMLEDDTQDHITFNKRQSDVDIITRTSTNQHAFVIRGDGSEVVVNEDGNSDTDLRVESDKSTRMLHVDSSSDAVYLHGPNDDSDILVVYGNGNDGLSGHNLFNISPTEITFNASSNDVDFRIAADNADPSQNTTDIGTDGGSQTHLTHNPNYAFFLNSNNGRVGLGTNVPDTTLHIAGSAHIEGDLWVKGNVNQVDTFVHMTSAVDITNKGTGPALTVNQTGIQPIATFRDDGRDILYIEDLGNVGFQTNNPHTSVYINDHDGIRIPVGTTAQRPVSGDYGITGDKYTADFSAMYGTIRYNHEYQTFEGFGPGNSWGSLGGVIDIDRDTFWTALNDISGSDYPGDPDALRAFVGIDNDPEGLNGQLMMTIKKDLTIIHSPDVGIGTTNPQGELHVRNMTSAPGGDPVKFILEGPEQAFGSSFPQPMGMIGFTSSESAIHHGVVDVAGIHARATKDFDTDSYGSELGFFTTNDFASSSTEKITIKQDGRVGIGTTSPEASLQVLQSTSTIAGTNLSNSRILAGTVADGIGIDSNEIVSSGSPLYIGTSSNEDVHIRTQGTTSRIIIDGATGDVGVNTNPTNKLHVYTNENKYAGYFRNDHTTAGGGILSLMPNAAASRYVAYLEGHTTHYGLYVKGDGKTGIGTNTPTGTLHIVPRTGTSSSSTTNTPLYLDTPANTVSMFIGTNSDTAGFGANSYSGNIRFNGNNTGWGDFGYYPTGGDNGEYGHFRFSRAGTNVNTTPDAKVGVGHLFVNSRAGLGTTTPLARLDIQESQNTSRATYSDAVGNAGLLISTNYTSDAFTPGIFWQTDNNNSTKPKGGVFMSMHGSGSRLHLGTSQSYSDGITRYVTINENGHMTINARENTQTSGVALDIRGWDSETTMLRVGASMDGAQGIGAIEVTQDGAYGGGMFYNGDGSPAFASGEIADWIGFYRMNAGTRTQVFGYSYSSSDVYFESDLYVPDQILHRGDGDTYMQFHAENQWRVVTGGGERLEVSNSETKVSNTLAIGDIKLKESADRADLLEITSTTGTWGGIQIRNSGNEGRWSLMTDGEVAGIYNDEDNQWHILMQEGGYTKLYHASNDRLTTTSSGVEFHDLDLQGVRDIYVGDQIIHDGDTNTYIQFDAADSWRVVTGGSERFSVDNSTITATRDMQVVKGKPVLILDSPSDGDNWTNQGAMIGLGESANISGSGTAALYLTYNGNGSSYIGTGGVNSTTGTPNQGFIRFTYNSNALYFSTNPSIAGNTNWHAGNDGSGSGLDADKVDGLQASQFLRSDTSDTFTTITGANLYINNTNTRIHEGSGNAIRIQTNSGYCDIGPQNTSHCHIYTDRGSFYFNKTLLYANGHTIWHAGNDGSGSGLDADLLDGRQGSGYVSTANNSSLNSDTRNTRGPTRLFRRDGNSDYSVQTHWTGSYWHLRGYVGDTFHGECQVGYASSAGSASSASSATTAGTASKVTVNSSDSGGNTYRLTWHSGTTMYSSSHFYISRDNKTLYSAGDIVAFASDARLKENITLIQNPLEKLSKINGYTFNFNKKGEEVVGQSQDKKQVGVLAQEIEQVLPEVIEPAPGDNEYKTVKYDKIVPLLIESIKAQQEQIDTLKQEIEQLKQR